MWSARLPPTPPRMREPERGRPMFRSILVPLDGSSFAEQALPLALSVARHSAARLVLATVSSPLTEAYVEGLYFSTLELEQDQAVRYESYLRSVAETARLR